MSTIKSSKLKESFFFSVYSLINFLGLSILFNLFFVQVCGYASDLLYYAFALVVTFSTVSCCCYTVISSLFVFGGDCAQMMLGNMSECEWTWIITQKCTALTFVPAWTTVKLSLYLWITVMMIQFRGCITTKSSINQENLVKTNGVSRPDHMVSICVRCLHEACITLTFTLNESRPDTSKNSINFFRKKCKMYKCLPVHISLQVGVDTVRNSKVRSVMWFSLTC